MLTHFQRFSTSKSNTEVTEMCAGIAATVYNGVFTTYLQKQTQTHKRLQLVLIP